MRRPLFLVLGALALLAVLLAAPGCARLLAPDVPPAAVRSLRRSINAEFDRLVKEFDRLDAQGDLELCDPISFSVARFALYQTVEEKRHADMAQLARFLTRAYRLLNAAQARFQQGTCVDSDGDGLTDLAEMRLYKTRPDRSDTDGDRLPDGLEVRRYRTDPLRADTDGDLLGDGEEVLRRLSPRHPDSDGDGYADGTEVAIGSDPRSPCSRPAGVKRRPGPWTRCRSGRVVTVSRPGRKGALRPGKGAPPRKKTAAAPAPSGAPPPPSSSRSPSLTRPPARSGPVDLSPFPSGGVVHPPSPPGPPGEGPPLLP